MDWRRVAHRRRRRRYNARATGEGRRTAKMSKEKKEKTPKKDKKEKTPKKDKRESDDSGDEGGSDEGKLRPTAPIAKPLADLKTTKKILKVVKKGTCVTTARVDDGYCGRIRWRDARRGGARIQRRARARIASEEEGTRD